MTKGIIYLMTTAVDGLIKIGKTETKNFKERMRHLEKNGYYNVVGLKCYFAMELENYSDKEKLLQEIFSKHQLADSELFALDIDLVQQLLLSFEGNVIYPQTPSKNKAFAATAQVRKRNQLFNFYTRGLKNGDIISFRAHEDFKAKVAGEREVIYEGKRYKLTPLAFALYEKLGKPRTSALQGAYHFNFKNTRLTQLPIK